MLASKQCHNQTSLIQGEVYGQCIYFDGYMPQYVRDTSDADLTLNLKEGSVPFYDSL